MSIGLPILRVVAGGIFTIEHDEFKTAETKAGPSSSPLALNVHPTREVADTIPAVASLTKALATMALRPSFIVHAFAGNVRSCAGASKPVALYVRPSWPNVGLSLFLP